MFRISTADRAHSSFLLCARALHLPKTWGTSPVPPHSWSVYLQWRYTCAGKDKKTSTTVENLIHMCSSSSVTFLVHKKIFQGFIIPNRHKTFGSKTLILFCIISTEQYFINNASGYYIPILVGYQQIPSHLPLKSRGKSRIDLCPDRFDVHACV